MSDAQYARRVSLRVSIDGHDVAGHFAPYLLEFSFTDNAHGKADEIQLSLHNRDGRFTGSWRPKKGMTVEAAIVCHDWEAQGAALSLPCGTFRIDEIEFSGPPDKIQIKAVSADLTGSLRESNKTRAWEHSNLEALAGQIAAENHLALHYAGPPHPFERQDQRNESDLAFLNRLANERGMNCKAHNGRLALFDANQAEAGPCVLTIAKAGQIYSPKSWSFKVSSSGTDYKKAEVAYTDPKTGDTHTAVVVSEKETDVPGSGAGKRPAAQGSAGEGYANGVAGNEKTLALQKRVEDSSQAIALGKGELHKANAKEQTASLECLGCPRLAAGQMLELTGFGDFSGRYFIKTATHRISGSGGYATSLELTTPAPSREVSAHDEVSLTAEAARAGAQAARKERRSFERLCELVQREGTKLDKLLVCLPEIAAHMAGRTRNFADRQGWLYLNEMFTQWFSGHANPDALLNPNVFWVDMDWALRYERVKQRFWALAAPSCLSTPNARQQLAEILRRDGCLSASDRLSFDYTQKSWTHWRNDYFQQITVEGMDALSADGLMAAMGNFQLRALAQGYTEPAAGGHIIAVTGISIFIWDSFNFEGEGALGHWRCSPPDFSPYGDDDLLELTNAEFRAFRKNFNSGNDFLVLSSPRNVDPWTAFAYETSL